MGRTAVGKRTKGYTPVIQQFLRAKEQHPDAVVFFRMGDFYEMFFEDAVHASALLDIALTSRGTDPNGKKIPMAGVPHHSAARYLAALLRHGEKVAVCEQMADPATVKGVVPREVVRVVTPGLCLEPDALDARQHNHLVAVTRDNGLAAFELSTGALLLSTLPDSTGVFTEVLRLEPAEVLLETGLGTLASSLSDALPHAAIRIVDLPGQDVLGATVTSILGEAQADDLRQQASPSAWRATAHALHYAQTNQPQTPLCVHRVSSYDPGHQLVLDEAAIRNLELLRTLDGEKRGSLLHLVDLTKTPMGARMLRQRLLSPLTDIAAIRRRHDAVDAFLPDAPWRQDVRATLAKIGDLERLATRVALDVATPRDLGAIRDGLNGVRELHAEVLKRPERDLDDALSEFASFDLCPDVHERLTRCLRSEPPSIERQGGIFADGMNDELDRLRELSASSKDVILKLEERERGRTGISSLKVKFTRVFGYYIEISRSRLDKVPDDYIRKQTVANAERFITEELSELQDRILNADERSRALELDLFLALRREIAEHATRISRLAHAVAAIDTSACWAEVAHGHDYVRPEVVDSLELVLEEARHPIVEQLAAEEGFVPNNISLDASGDHLMVLTGPNMSGKSTAMRQVALAVIMAQAGGFVPAKRALIGVVDRVFTRVGASDNLSKGQSTFMVEMTEAATILREATRRSLVILDEIGRGTSTYDGLAIAWAMTEHLHDVVGCRTIFATHYHELCELADRLSHAMNFNVAAKERGDSVIFLHQLVSGGANRSYGISVAQLAGVPPVVLARAKLKLHALEAKNGEGDAPESQMRLFSPPPLPESEVEQTLSELDLDRMTPIDALNSLARLKSLLNKGD